MLKRRINSIPSDAQGMNYLFINGRFPQYSQTFVHDQIKAVKTHGASVEVFARSLASFRFEQSAPECAEALIYGKPFNSTIALRMVSGVVRHPLRAMKLAGLYKAKKITYSTLMLGLQMRRSPDVAITHFGNNFRNGIDLKRHVFPKMKNVVVFHGHDISSFVRKNGWRDYKDAAPFIDMAICVNRIWAASLRENTEIRDIRTIYLGTAPEPMIRKRNGDNDVYSILFVGRFVEKKGFDLLYRAVKDLRVTMKRRFRVHCVGDGPDLPKFKQRAKSEGLNETFVFYGSKQKSFVRQLMQECDLLVAPSRVAEDGDSEGLPVVLMEAMMTGIPVLSTMHSGIPELIEHLRTGLLVAENDLVSLEKAITFAARNPDLMQQLSRQAHDHVRAAHNEVTQTHEFVAALGEIA